MHNDGAAEDGVLAKEREVAVEEGALRVAVAVGMEVAEVADVADGVEAVAVGHGLWVVVGAGGVAAVGEVAKLVDVEAAQGLGGAAVDVPGDVDEGARVGLLKVESASDGGLASKDGD